MFTPKFILLLLCTFALLLNQGYPQNTKCSNSTNPYLCDPGFENSSLRNGSIIYPATRSYIGGSILEVNRCMGGPRTDVGWGNRWFWHLFGPEYNANMPVHDIPDFLSWDVPTRGTSDYFNRHADTVLYPWQYIQSVDVPNNFIGWQH
jgi:hypothetical protein